MDKKAGKSQYSSDSPQEGKSKLDKDSCVDEEETYTRSTAAIPTQAETRANSLAKARLESQNEEETLGSDTFLNVDLKYFNLGLARPQDVPDFSYDVVMLDPPWRIAGSNNSDSS